MSFLRGAECGWLPEAICFHQDLREYYWLAICKGVRIVAAFRILLTFLICLVLLLFLSPGQCSAKVDFFSVDDEVTLGQQFYHELEKGEIKDFRICGDKAILLKINGIGQKLAKVSMKRMGIEYRFIAIEREKKPYINAFSVPGGYICVGKDLFKDFDENGIAFVLAHEMAHTDNADCLKSVNIKSAMEDQDKVMKETGYSKNSVDIDALLKSCGRKEEYAADAYGALYMYRAGYDPGGAITAIQKLKKLSGGEYEEGLEEWVDHPSYQGREDNLKGYINKMKYIETLFSRGVKQLQLRELDEAIDCFNKFLSVFYGCPQAYNNLGYAYFLKAMNDSETGGWYWAEGIDPSYERDYLVTRGGTSNEALDLLDLQNAISFFKKALEYHPDYELARNNLIITYWVLGEKDNAQKEIAHQEKTGDRTPEFLNTLGIISFSRGDTKKAEELFEESSRLKNGYPPAVFNLGLINRKCNNSGKARECFTRFMKLRADSKDPWMDAAREYLK